MAAHGWQGIAGRIDHQTRVADHLRTLLRARGFTVLNDTPLPLVCFTHARLPDAAAHERVATRLRLDQTAWLSRVILGGRIPALRACITSYETRPDDMDTLVRAVEQALEP
jgi:aromatic-L-amino-acid decarboxylase